MNGFCSEERAAAPPRRVRLEPVYFDFNESALTTEATAALARDVDCLKKVGRVVTLRATRTRAAPRSTTSRSPSGAPSRCAITSDAWAATAQDDGPAPRGAGLEGNR